MKAVVIGGGIAGLATTYGLQQAGRETTVLERSAGPQPRGSGLSLFANGFQALNYLGLGAAVRAVCADGPPRHCAHCWRLTPRFVPHSDDTTGCAVAAPSASPANHA